MVHLITCDFFGIYLFTSFFGLLGISLNPIRHPRSRGLRYAERAFIRVCLRRGRGIDQNRLKSSNPGIGPDENRHRASNGGPDRDEDWQGRSFLATDPRKPQYRRSLLAMVPHNRRPRRSILPVDPVKSRSSTSDFGIASPPRAGRVSSSSGRPSNACRGHVYPLFPINLFQVCLGMGTLFL